MLSEIEEEAAAKRGDRPVLGVDKILTEDARQRPRKPKKSPAPMLFFAEKPEIRKAQINTYEDFVDEYELAADRLVKAALEERRLDPTRHFPAGSFPPVVIAELLEAAQGFNPNKEFPRGSFPRPWPFVGGRLPPAPPTPPTRRLIYKGPDDPTIGWRGEIPTVQVPRRESDRRRKIILASPSPDRKQERRARPSPSPVRDPP